MKATTIVHELFKDRRYVNIEIYFLQKYSLYEENLEISLTTVLLMGPFLNTLNYTQARPLIDALICR